MILSVKKIETQLNLKNTGKKFLFYLHIKMQYKDTKKLRKANKLQEHYSCLCH